MNVIFQSWKDVKLEQLTSGIARRFIYGEQAMVAQFELKSGAVVPWHQHPNEQISLVLEGRIRFEFGSEDAKEIVEAVAGDTVVIPSNLPHKAVVLEDTRAFDVFVPPRQDWITGDDAYLRGAQEGTNVRSS
jgi:quercetin dioxygenase-like cupin family protein